MSSEPEDISPLPQPPDNISAEKSISTQFGNSEKKDVILALDFDGVIHKYSKGWHDGTIYDEPIPGAIAFIAEVMWKHQWSVFIMSTRNSEQIKEWFEKVIFKKNEEAPFSISIIDDSIQKWDKKCHLGITNRKLQATAYVDDRGITFNGNFDELFLKLKEFKTWMNRT